MPQRSTRDPAELRANLEHWLRERIARDAEVTSMTPPTGNGMSSETLVFDATWSEDDGTRSASLVARVAPDPAAVPVFPVYDLDRQFRVMQLVRERTTVPVPRVFWSEAEGRYLGAPFFVMERVDGVVPPDIMPYNFGSWLSEATPEQQARLQAAAIGVIARLHAIERPEETFAFLELNRAAATPLRRHLADQRAYYGWAMDGLRVPLLERAFAWIEDRWPPDEGDTVFNWGDARIGNILFREFEPVAVLDWEMAALAPRELDVGWTIFFHRFFEEVAAQHGLPGMPHFMRRDDVAGAYESLTGHAPRDLDFYTAYAALRHGIIMARIALRAVHFGEATMPDDPDELVSHRAMLEAMLAGSYWSSV